MTSILPKDLYEKTLAHLSRYKSGTQPYKHYQLLQLFTHLYQPKKILELGTAVGLTAISMAQASLKSEIDTIEFGE